MSLLGALLLLITQPVDALPQSNGGRQVAFQAAVTASEQAGSGPRPLVIWSVSASLAVQQQHC